VDRRTTCFLLHRDPHHQHLAEALIISGVRGAFKDSAPATIPNMGCIRSALELPRHELPTEGLRARAGRVCRPGTAPWNFVFTVCVQQLQERCVHMAGPAHEQLGSSRSAAVEGSETERWVWLPGDLSTVTTHQDLHEPPARIALIGSTEDAAGCDRQDAFPGRSWREFCSGVSQPRESVAASWRGTYWLGVMAERLAGATPHCASRLKWEDRCGARNADRTARP